MTGGESFSARWASDWNEIGASPPDPRLLPDLLAGYRDPRRAYHTLQHLQECFAHLDAARPWADRPGEVAVALWFHDAIYDSHASDNEVKSADWAAKALLRAGAPDATGARVRGLILATRHLTARLSGDEALIADIDLAILGAPEARFDEYDSQIRREYEWVPMPRYREVRQRILAGFLARDSIYFTSYFAGRFEAQARSNLRRAIARLDA